MSYVINFKPAALRQIRKLPKQLQSTIITAIEELSDNARPEGCKKLKNSDSLYRIRVAKSYRVIYEIQDKQLMILIVKIGHRSDIYK
ncbi:MAG: type II toxin-antitoxin system RelE/ParE family toxin [Snowella sp.]|nr:type II toxin-antitoxin system RelE/ParE family toxin [Snowella sp.]